MRLSNKIGFTCSRLLINLNLLSFCFRRKTRKRCSGGRLDNSKGEFNEKKLFLSPHVMLCEEEDEEESKSIKASHIDLNSLGADELPKIFENGKLVNGIPVSSRKARSELNYR